MEKKEGRNGSRDMADGAALVIRKDAYMTCHIFHVRLVRAIILKWHLVHWQSLYFYSYAQIRLIYLLVFSKGKISHLFTDLLGKAWRFEAREIYKQANYVVGTDSIIQWQLFIKLCVESQFLPPYCLLSCSVLIEKHVQ